MVLYASTRECTSSLGEYFVLVVGKIRFSVFTVTMYQITNYMYQR